MSLSLPGQLPDENIIKVIHRDAFIAFKRVALFFLLLALFIGLGLVIYDFDENILTSNFYPLLLVLGLVYVLFCWVFLFFSLIDYVLDVWVVTSERLVNIKQEGFFSRSVVEIELSHIQDMASEVRGVFPTVLGFGTLYIQTASDKERFKFEEVSYPDDLRTLISQLIAAKESKQIKNNEA